ncbi:uncharacterized protein LOC103698520 [Phoenix dactylifera]|uniref:Uncharacterized protein LOC103698520 n=1 Tax=Phoenix dactylifera TaxID=42345 RepID=A0A8B9AJ44_PHODC|nr:uncharacterized protein LOC103698520 [Phoenix dactylifera]XP_038983298.1 uncharacterized protein LOC103698520 [Phoenix dactylifera]XP_038983299.1 uncharacterized protein LOC103698520 [Phoenix dactylifera]
MAKKKRSRIVMLSKVAPEKASSDCYEGDRLDGLLSKLERSIEAAKILKGDLPEKIWIKHQFAIGVNDVSRVLERMPLGEMQVHSKEDPETKSGLRRAPLVPLQAVILASDCNPRWLTKHIPSLASSRQVPVIFVKDNKGGSLRLGELVKVKTALAIGVKARESCINRTIDKVLGGNAVADGDLEMAV